MGPLPAAPSLRHRRRPVSAVSAASPVLTADPPAQEGALNRGPVSDSGPGHRPSSRHAWGRPHRSASVSRCGEHVDTQGVGAPCLHSRLLITLYHGSLSSSKRLMFLHRHRSIPPPPHRPASMRPRLLQPPPHRLVLRLVAYLRTPRCLPPSSMAGGILAAACTLRSGIARSKCPAGPSLAASRQRLESDGGGNHRLPCCARW